MKLFYACLAHPVQQAIHEAPLPRDITAHSRATGAGATGLDCSQKDVSHGGREHRLTKAILGSWRSAQARVHPLDRLTATPKHPSSPRAEASRCLECTTSAMREVISIHVGQARPPISCLPAASRARPSVDHLRMGKSHAPARSVILCEQTSDHAHVHRRPCLLRRRLNAPPVALTIWALKALMR